MAGDRFSPFPSRFLYFSFQLSHVLMVQICNVVICLEIEKKFKLKECMLNILSFKKQAFAQGANPAIDTSFARG